jgi:putative dimethyl sulfoxide reductase chaperone
MDINSQQNNILKSYNMLLYFAGSMIMYEPSEECIVDFWKNGIVKKLPVSSSNPNFIKAASQLRYSCEDDTTCGKILREDYIRLFARQTLSLAPVYESQYHNTGQINSGKIAPRVTEFYNAYGWTPKFRGKLMDDHLGIELLFLTILIEKYLVLDDDACQVEMRGEIRRFINEHILSWVPEWNESIQQHAKTLCYKGIGTLIFACVEDIYSFLGQSISASHQSNNLKN